MLIRTKPAAWLACHPGRWARLNDIGGSCHVTSRGRPLYGPRFLYSTGQFHKGGLNTGVFLQLTADDASDLPVPGQPYTFGIFKRAAALGDLEGLRTHGRRVIRIHLGADVDQGLDALTRAIDPALLDGLSVK